MVGAGGAVKPRDVGDGDGFATDFRRSLDHRFGLACA
jgi:hypothetical protein